MKEERVVIVDEENRVQGSALRSEMRKKRLWHRASYVLVFNSERKIFCHRRTPTKDVYPSHWDVCAGGVVGWGETYEECAQRELFEELGIRGVELQRLFDFSYEGPQNRIWGRVFRCVWDGPLKLQEEEVAEGRFVGVEEAASMAKTLPFTPDGRLVLERYLQQYPS